MSDDGGLFRSLEAAKQLLAATDEWQAWCEIAPDLSFTARVDLAMTRIHTVFLPAPQRPKEGFTRAELESGSPFALISPGTGGRLSGANYVLDRVGTGDFTERGQIDLFLVASIPDGLVGMENEIAEKQMRQISRLIDQMRELCDRDGYMTATRIETNPEDCLVIGDNVYAAHQGNWVQSVIRITWGEE